MRWSLQDGDFSFGANERVLLESYDGLDERPPPLKRDLCHAVPRSFSNEQKSNKLSGMLVTGGLISSYVGTCWLPSNMISKEQKTQV